MLFGLWREHNTMPEEGLSDANGNYEFTMKNVGVHAIIASKQGFVTCSKQLSMTKAAMETCPELTITVPMMPLIQSSTAYAVLCYNGMIK